MNNKGIEMIKEFEGLRLQAYKPVATEKYWTIGYGHYGPEITEGMTITKEEADKLFEQDIRNFCLTVEKNVPATLPRDSVDALISFCYNVGSGNFLRSTLLKVIKADKNNLPKIEKEWNKWVYSGKTVLKGLQRRRKKEFQLYREGILGQYSKQECYDLGRSQGQI